MASLVLHVDMDAFFAGVEIRSDPRLAGLPLVVGGGPDGRGVVTTASYAARPFGVRSGMSLAQALRLCPGLTVLPVDPPKILDASREVLRILEDCCPRVEAASIDEAYLEFPSPPESRWVETARILALRIRDQVRKRSGLCCSVGAGPNKLQAKMATSRGKPGGIWVLAPGRFLQEFGNEPVSRIPGVGVRTTEVLERLGIHTIAELSRGEHRERGIPGGVWASWLQDQARGVDSRRVLAAGEEATPKSAGHETTFSRDVADAAYLRGTLWLLADRVARRLRLYRLAARGVAVRYKLGRKRYSRQCRLPHPATDPRVLAQNGWRLLEAGREGRALRLLGIAGLDLTEDLRAPILFTEDRKRAQLIGVEDRLRDRFGERVFLPGAAMTGRRRTR